MPENCPRYTSILLDLDGTIMDSAPGILSSLVHALDRMGLPVPGPDEIVHWIGPPILDAFRDQAGLDEAESKRALAHYRRHYLSTGLFDAQLYEGMAPLIRRIRSLGIPLSLATSKPETMAGLILDHVGLAQNFTHLTGASDDERRSAKSDVILEALRRLRGGGADLSRPIMVGDRYHDVLGAADRGIPAIFVSWGYGEDTEKAGAIGVADTPAQLSDMLGLELPRN